MTLTSLPVWPNTVWFDELPSPNSRNRGKTMWPHQPSFPVSINDSGSAFKSVSKRSCSRLSAPVIARTWQGTTKNQHEWICPTPPSIFQDGPCHQKPQTIRLPMLTHGSHRLAAGLLPLRHSALVRRHLQLASKQLEVVGPGGFYLSTARPQNGWKIVVSLCWETYISPTWFFLRCFIDCLPILNLGIFPKQLLLQ